MNDYVDIWSIAVGQGQMNFVEITDGATNLYKGLVLIDCGGSNGVIQGPSRVLINTIMQRHNDTIDLVLISHTDDDHSNLLTSIPCVCMKFMLYGCVNGNFNNTYLGGVVQQLVNSGKLLRHEQADNTYFNNGVHFFNFNNINIVTDVEFRVIISNYGVRANDASTIWQLAVGSKYAIFAGDATATTMRIANGIIAANYNSFSPMNNSCRFITLPHHGSIVTAGGVPRQYIDVKDCVKLFGTYLRPKTSVSSSALHNGWIHSSEYVRRAVLPNPDPMASHACYVHDLNNDYVKGQYIIAFFTNSSSYNDNIDIDLSYFIRIDRATDYPMGFTYPNSNVVQFNYTPIRSPKPNASKAKRIVSAVKISQERG
ncbi:MAG TPA: hypothetical protein VHQ24_02810 [Lachnospiraceae bacterium]|nr:hypothetical protein [Lachnospiraceae bacterium]